MVNHKDYEEEKQSTPLIKGDFVRYRKRIFGVIEDVWKDGNYLFVFHNGMKPTTNIAKIDKLEKISRERFAEYIKKSGDTSMRKYL